MSYRKRTMRRPIDDSTDSDDRSSSESTSSRSSTSETSTNSDSETSTSSETETPSIPRETEVGAASRKRIALVTSRKKVGPAVSRKNVGASRDLNRKTLVAVRATEASVGHKSEGDEVEVTEQADGEAEVTEQADGEDETPAAGALVVHPDVNLSNAQRGDPLDGVYQEFDLFMRTEGNPFHKIPDNLGSTKAVNLMKTEEYKTLTTVLWNRIIDLNPVLLCCTGGGFTDRPMIRELKEDLVNINMSWFQFLGRKSLPSRAVIEEVMMYILSSMRELCRAMREAAKQSGNELCSEENLRKVQQQSNIQASELESEKAKAMAELTKGVTEMLQHQMKIEEIEARRGGIIYQTFRQLMEGCINIMLAPYLGAGTLAGMTAIILYECKEMAAYVAGIIEVCLLWLADNTWGVATQTVAEDAWFPKRAWMGAMSYIFAGTTYGAEAVVDAGRLATPIAQFAADWAIVIGTVAAFAVFFLLFSMAQMYTGYRPVGPRQQTARAPAISPVDLMRELKSSSTAPLQLSAAPTPLLIHAPASDARLMAGSSDTLLLAAPPGPSDVARTQINRSREATAALARRSEQLYESSTRPAAE